MDEALILRDTPRKSRVSSQTRSLDVKRDDLVTYDVGHKIPQYDIAILIESVLPHIEADIFDRMKSEVFGDKKSVKNRFRGIKPSGHDKSSERITFMPLKEVFSDIFTSVYAR